MEYPASSNLVGQGSTSVCVYHDIHLHIYLFNLENPGDYNLKKDKHLVLIIGRVVKNPSTSSVTQSDLSRNCFY